MGIARFPPSASKPRNKATGPEVIYVLEGEVMVQVDRQATRIVHASENYPMSDDVVHSTAAGVAGAKATTTCS